MKFIPVNEPLLGEKEKRLLGECVDSGWISSEGPFVRRFEESLASAVGRNHGVAVSNGSAALDAAVAALNLGPGDEVILPTFTIISCAAPIVRCGAKPVFVDCDPVTWNMEASHVLDRITDRTKAILAVHIYGLPVDMDPILEEAKRLGLHVIEDAAEAIGLRYRDKPCGSMGTISTFSFYPNKLITTGEGGMVLCDDEVLADRCRSLRNLCFKPEQRFVHDELGWNLRMTNMQAALGVAQLENLQSSIEKKRRIGALYNERLKGIEGLTLPSPKTENAENIYWVYGVVLDSKVPFDARVAMKRLASKGIGTRPFFWPLHEQPVFNKMGIGVHDCFPVAENIARRGFYLPSGLALEAEQVEHVCDAVEELLA